MFRLIALMNCLAIGMSAGSALRTHQPAKCANLSLASLDRFLGGSCNHQGNLQITCATGSGASPCTATTSCASNSAGTLCVMIVTTSPNTCSMNGNPSTNCSQTNSGNCATIKSGSNNPDGSCSLGSCTNSGSGCGASNSSTTVTGC